jgi:hypothetical protein
MSAHAIGNPEVVLGTFHFGNPRKFRDAPVQERRSGIADYAR